MEEHESQHDIDLKVYIVPKNVSTRLEFFPGFGMREIGIVLIAAVAGASLGLILWFIQGSALWVGFAVPTGAIGFLLGKPNPRTGRSPLHLIRDHRRYKSRPKRYYYRYGDGRG